MIMNKQILLSAYQITSNYLTASIYIITHRLQLNKLRFVNTAMSKASFI